MYKILIVEDDRTARNMILQSIDWAAEGYEPFVASNGLEALQLLEETPCDVLLSDIEMPLMNGLQLTQQLRDCGQNLPVIFLTAHADFPLVQSALQNNAIDYLLKPVTKPQLLEAIRKAKKRLRDAFAAWQNYEKLEQEWNQNMSLLQEQFLGNLLLSEHPFADSSLLKSYHLDLSDTALCVGYLQPTFSKATVSEVAPHIQAYSIFQFLREYLSKGKQGYAYLQPDGIALLYMAKNTPDFSHKMAAFFTGLQQQIEKHMGIQLSIGIGRVVLSAKQLHESYNSAILAFNYNALREKEPVFLEADISISQIDRTQNRLSLTAELSNALLICNRPEVDRMISNIFKCSTRMESIRLNAFTVFMSILMVSESVSDHLAADLPDDRTLWQILSNNEVLTLRSTLSKLCHQVMDVFETSQHTKTENLVQTALRYVDAHYSDSTLSTESICKTMFVSMSHFCSIFKKSTGQTFMNYLNNLRMEKAAQLLTGSAQRIHDIAASVGFPDTNYFSLCFKKAYGLSPREYRRLHGAADKPS